MIAFRPRKVTEKSQDPVSAKAARRQSSSVPKAKKSAKEATILQELVEAKAIEGSTVLRKDGIYVALCEVEGEIFNLLSEEEQDGRLSAYTQVLNSLPWEVQITLFTEAVSLRDYEDYLKTHATSEVGQTWLGAVQGFLENVWAEKTVFSVTGKSASEADTRAKQLLGALTRQSFRARVCGSERLSEILLLSYGHPSDGGVAAYYGGPLADLKGLGEATSPIPTLADLISPPAVTEKPGMLDLGGVYAASALVVAYPSDVSNGWLEPLYHFHPEGIRIRVSFHLRPVASGQAIQEISKKLVDLSVAQRFAAKRGQFANVETELGLEDAYGLRQDIARGAQKIFDVTALVTLLSDRPDRVREAMAQLKQQSQGYMLPIRETYLQEVSAFASTVPLGHAQIRRDRPIPTLALSTTFPFTAGELLDSRGDFWGMNLLTGNAVVLDSRDLRGSPHGLIIGTTGSGKSVSFKTIVSQAFLDENTDVIVIDPSPPIDYRRFTEAFGGTYALFGAGTGHKINVCALLLPEDLSVLGDEDHTNPVTAKIAALISILGLMAYPKEEIPPEERALLETPLYAMYAERGMTDDWNSLFDTATKSPRPVLKAMPTLSDALRHIEKTPGLERFALRLRPYVTGTLAMFNGETNVDIESRLLVFNVYQLAQAGGEDLQRAAYALIMEHIRTHLLASRRRKVVGIDEAHLLFNRRDTAKFVATLERTARKVSGQVYLLTQSITDFVGDPRTHTEVEGQNDARVCLGQTGVTFLMANDKAYDIDLLRDVFTLSDSEAAFLKRAQPGQGVLLVKDRRALVQVIVPPKLYPLVHTNPEAL